MALLVGHTPSTLNNLGLSSAPFATFFPLPFCLLHVSFEILFLLAYFLLFASSLVWFKSCLEWEMGWGGGKGTGHTWSPRWICKGSGGRK